MKNIKFWDTLMFISIFAPIFVGMCLDSFLYATITFFICISFFMLYVFRDILPSRSRRNIEHFGLTGEYQGQNIEHFGLTGEGQDKMLRTIFLVYLTLKENYVFVASNGKYYRVKKGTDEYIIIEKIMSDYCLKLVDDNRKYNPNHLKRGQKNYDCWAKIPDTKLHSLLVMARRLTNEQVENLVQSLQDAGLPIFPSFDENNKEIWSTEYCRRSESTPSINQLVTTGACRPYLTSILVQLNECTKGLNELTNLPKSSKSFSLFHNGWSPPE